MGNLEKFSDIVLTLIAACGPRGELGLQGQLPWHQPADLAFFKKVTRGGVVICGSRTFASLPGLLPGRRHIVVSRGSVVVPEGVACVLSWEQLRQQLHNWGATEAFLIGGAELYRHWGPMAQRCWITHFNTPCSADCFFPLELLQGRPILECEQHEAQGSNWARSHVLYGPLLQ